MERFVFPETNYRSIKDKKSLVEAIEKERTELDIIVKFNFYSVRQYLYAKCKFKKCKAYLRFKRENEEDYRLIKQNCFHHHIKSSETTSKKIEIFINDLPLTLNTQTIKKLVMDKFHIKEARFYYLYRKVKHNKMSFKELIEYLNEHDCEIRTDPFHSEMNELPRLMIIVTPKMKENFSKYGHWIGFDFTFNLIQELHSSGKSWKVGFFMGISTSKKLVPYGIVVSTDETKDEFEIIFKSFFEIMKKEPKVIISDEDNALTSALKSLKDRQEFAGTHLLDCYHIMKNIKKNLKEKKHWSLFKSLIYQETEEEFEYKLKEGSQTIESEEDENLLTKFTMNSGKYCFSQIPPVFFGFLPNTSMNEKVHDLIKNIIPYSKPYVVTIKNILEYLEELGDKCKRYELSTLKAEEFFNFPFLKEVRYSVSKSIFERIVDRLSKSIHYHQITVEIDRYEITDQQIVFEIKLDEEKRWKCSCPYQRKTGIPCSHLFKILLMRKSRIIPYIHPHWILEKENSNEIKRFQRKTRRNRIK